jgi:Mrp family chromosome partitioning ATPase
LQNVLAEQINQVNDRSATNPLSSKQDILKQKLELETNLELAKNSVSSLDDEVNNLTRKLNVLAPNQANIQSFERDIEVESREYVELSKKYDEAVMESSFPIKLRQVEMAMPTAPEPSKKILIVALSGIVSFMFCAGILFGLFYFDKTINNSQQLANKTQQNVIGELNLINGPRQAADVWTKEYETPAVKQFKSFLRSIRFEIDSELDGAKVVGITSLRSFEGKTFLALNLATAYKMINKRVMLIDGNFDNPSISEIASPDIYLEDYLLSKSNITALLNSSEKSLLVMGNRGGDISLLEVANSPAIHAKLKELEEHFDIILIEMPALEVLNKAREWISFSEKLITVFEAGQTIDLGHNKEIQYLRSLNSKMLGWIMNKIETEIEKPKRLKDTKRISLYKSSSA